MNKGFITIPILLITLLGLTVVGGGGYAVYKVNQIQQESDTRVSELEKKIEQIAPEEPVVEVVVEVSATTTATSSVEEVVIEEKPIVVTPAVVRSQVVSTPITLPVVVTPQVLQSSVDVCSNVDGLQTVLPQGYVQVGTQCEIRIERDRWGLSETDWQAYEDNLVFHESQRKFYNEEARAFREINENLLEYRETFVFTADYYDGSSLGDAGSDGIKETRDALAKLSTAESKLKKIVSLNESIIDGTVERYGETIQGDVNRFISTHKEYLETRDDFMEENKQVIIILSEIMNYYGL